MLHSDRLNDQEFVRYSRQIMLPRVGEAGQLLLKQASCAIIGVGGLGQQVAQLLAAAGLSKLLLIDHDTISVDNLPRQLLYSEDDVGHYKVDIAGVKLSERYPHCDVVTSDSAFCGEHDLTGVDLILDCSDNFRCRYLVNRVASSLDVPLISAAMSGDDGLLALFDPVRDPESGCYQCLFPESVSRTENCSNMGVLGPAVAVMASLQAQLALNYLFNRSGRFGYLLRFNAQTLTFHRASLSRDMNCPICGASNKEFCV